MNKIKFIFSALLIVFGILIPSANVCQAEEIKVFNSDIKVHNNGLMDVEETILYNSAGLEKHGIYRNIRLISSQGRKMNIENIDVTADGFEHKYSVSYSGDYANIVIGDKKKTFSGIRVYKISYTVSPAVGYLDDFDEIYWNATGDQYPFPILSATAKVKFDNGTYGSDPSCYSGPYGALNQCLSLSKDNNEFTFSISDGTALNPGAGMTVAVRIPKGFITEIAGVETTFKYKFLQVLWVVIPILAILISFVYLFRKWKKKGMDPKGTGVIVPQYDIPDGLTPYEVSAIYKEGVSMGDVSAEMIYLAIKGYIKIKEIDNGFLKGKDYKIIKLKEIDSSEKEHDKMLMEELFRARKGGLDFSFFGTKKKAENNTVEEEGIKSVLLSDLKMKFVGSLKLVARKVITTVKAEGYYSNLEIHNNEFRQNTFVYILISIITAVYLSVIAWAVTNSVIREVVGVYGNDVMNSLWPMTVFVISIIFAFFMRIMPAKTAQGVQTKEYIDGLKMYLQIAEKDRLLFHNAPEKKPEIFEKFLPYAMVLGVAGIWAKEFSDIYMSEPNWYASAYVGGFSATNFSTDIAKFSSFSNSALCSSSGHGSGGGGFSGGGGGGGGGGSW